jgi:hypothetical protein
MSNSKTMTASAPHFAFLLAAPQPGETAMYRDLVAMAEALLARGFAAILRRARQAAGS